MRDKLKSDRGNALIETAITIPILLLITVGIFELGRMFQTWEIVSNAAREAARVAILPSSTPATATGAARTYMTNGQLSRAATAAVTVNKASSYVANGVTVSASLVTVDYPFDFMVLGPVARLVSPTSTAGNSITMRATAIMRNEQ